MNTIEKYGDRLTATKLVKKELDEFIDDNAELEINTKHFCDNSKLTVVDSNAKYLCSSAFSSCSGLITVNLPNITGIGEQTFYGCTSLQSIAIGDKATYISERAFENCTSLKSIEIPGSVISRLGHYAFLNCTSLTDAVIGNGVTSLGTNLFSGCSSLKTVSIGTSVTSFWSSVFRNCRSLTNIVIPDSVTDIQTEAFYGCSSLSSVTLSKNLKSIMAYMFYDCTSLKSIDIPDSVTSVGYNAFDGCTSLASVDIPDSVTSIGNFAFNGCTALASVNIPNSVTSIGSYAFYNCTSLTSIDIPDSITSIGKYAFYKCTSLTSITIPDPVTSIGDYAFQSCTSITSVTIGNSVTSIGDYAFYGCTALTSIAVSSSDLTIGANAFSNCTALTSINLPGSIVAINQGAFSGCSLLSEVNIPNKIASLSYKLFADQTNLASVTIGEVSSCLYSNENGPLYGSNIETLTVNTSNLRSLYTSDTNTSVPFIDSHWLADSENFYVNKSTMQDTSTVRHLIFGSNVHNLPDNCLYEASGLYDIRLTSDSLDYIGDCSLLCEADCLQIDAANIATDIFGLDADGTASRSLSPWSLVHTVHFALDDFNTWYAELSESTKKVFWPSSGTIVNNNTVLCKAGDALSDGTVSASFSGTIYDFYGTMTEIDLASTATTGETVSKIDLIQLHFGEKDRYTTGSIIKSVVIPNTVTTIDNMNFSVYSNDNCNISVELTIPQSLTTFTSIELLKTTKCLDKIYIDSGNTSFYSSADNTAITKTANNEVIYLANNGTIPDTASTISRFALYNRQFSTLKVPASITSLCSTVHYMYFNGASIDNIEVDQNNSTYDSRDNCNCVIETATNTLLYGCATNAIIPATVTTIGAYAFTSDCKATSITIPNNISSIASYAFYYCKTLVSIIYSGTTADWLAISKSTNWYYQIPSTVIITCTDGTVTIDGVVTLNS